MGYQHRYQQFPPGAEKFMAALVKEEQPAISAITEIELLCWRTADEKDLEVLHNFISDALVIELELPIKLKTAELRKAYRIKLPDAVIAATALIYDLTLLSRNLSDFDGIDGDGLKVINPWEKE